MLNLESSNKNNVFIGKKWFDYIELLMKMKFWQIILNVVFFRSNTNANSIY